MKHFICCSKMLLVIITFKAPYYMLHSSNGQTRATFGPRDIDGDIQVKDDAMAEGDRWTKDERSFDPTTLPQRIEKHNFTVKR